MLVFMLKAGINGYGTIGRRVAHALSLQPDITVVGIVKTKPDYVAKIASRNFKVYVNDKKNAGNFENGGINVAGTVEDLAESVDVMIDATPEGIAEKNKGLYESKGIRAVFQGGEKATIAQSSFNAYSNFSESIGKKYVRVVSCNTTGLARTLYPVKDAFGLKHVYATLIRRATDPNDSKKGPINAIEPSMKIPSHHAPDLGTVLSGVDADTVAIKVPTTLMHVHVVRAQIDKDVSAENVLSEWGKYRRIIALSGADGVSSTAQIMDAAKEMGGSRSDLYEIAVWKETVGVKSGVLNYVQAVNQESDVVPENVDALRAMFELEEKEKSIEMTDRSLGIGRRKI